MVCRVTVNGVTYVGKRSVQVSNNRVVIDGVEQPRSPDIAVNKLGFIDKVVRWWKKHVGW